MMDGSDQLPPGFDVIARQIAELTVRVNKMSDDLGHLSKAVSAINEWIKQP